MPHHRALPLGRHTAPEGSNREHPGAEEREHHLRNRLGAGHHDATLSDEQGQIVARRRIDTGVQGYRELLGLLAEHSDDPTSVPITIETDKNLLVVALLHAGFEVYAINPGQWPATGSGTSIPGRNPALAMPRSWRVSSWRVSCAPIGTCTDDAADQRCRLGGEGLGPPASGSDLGAAPDDQQAALDAVRVLPTGAGRVPHAHPTTRP